MLHHPTEVYERWFSKLTDVLQRGGEGNVELPTEQSAKPKSGGLKAKIKAFFAKLKSKKAAKAAEKAEKGEKAGKAYKADTADKEDKEKSKPAEKTEAADTAATPADPAVTEAAK